MFLNYLLNKAVMFILINYTVREKCIFYNTKLSNTYFNEDYENFIAQYQVNCDTNIDDIVKIPYNIFV